MASKRSWPAVSQSWNLKLAPFTSASTTLKSRPIVDSMDCGKDSLQRRSIKQDFPTPISPMKQILTSMSTSNILLSNISRMEPFTTHLLLSIYLLHFGQDTAYVLQLSQIVCPHSDTIGRRSLWLKRSLHYAQFILNIDKSCLIILNYHFFCSKKHFKSKLSENRSWILTKY